MALKFIEGFEITPTSDLGKKWAVADWGTVTITYAANQRMVGGNALWMTGNNLTSPDLGDAATYVTGFAFMWINLSTPIVVFQYLDQGTEQVRLLFNPSTHVFSIMCGTSVLGTGTKVISPSTWYYVEFKATMGNPTGSVFLNIAGIPDIQATGINTVISNNAVINTINFRGGAGVVYLLDDIYVLDSSGTINNDFLGDMIVEALVPNRRGDSNDWNVVSSSSLQNWQAVDAIDTNMVQSGNVGDEDTYGINALQRISASIAGVMIHIFGRNENSTQRSVAPIFRVAGTDYQQPQLTFTDTAQQIVTQILEVDPSINAAWQAGVLRDMEIGMKLTV